MMTGGVAICVRNNIDYKERPQLEINIEGSFKSMFIETNYLGQKRIIGEIYRVPNINEREAIVNYECIIDRLIL